MRLALPSLLVVSILAAACTGDAPTTPGPTASRAAGATGTAIAITDLGALPGSDYSNAYGINASDEVVGFSITASNSLHAVQWDRRGNIADLGTLPGADFSLAEGINASGVAVGMGQTAAGQYHAVRWAGGTVRDIGTLPGGSFSNALAINDDGEIAGQSNDATGYPHAVLWRKNGKIVDLGTLPDGSFSRAAAIDHEGRVVGNSETTGHVLRATLWDHGRAINLGTLGDSSGAEGINDEGVVIGSSTVDNYPHAFTWQRGKMRDLGGLPNTIWNNAHAINDAGWVVGRSDAHAVLWRQDGAPVDLGVLPGGHYSYAVAINAAGTIAGTSSTANYSGHAILWRVTRDR